MTIDQRSHNTKYKININLNENYKEIEINKVKYKYILKLSDQNFSKIDVNILLNKIISNDNFQKYFFDLDLNFYLIIWSEDFLFCAVDHVCSYQLLYEINKNEINIINNISSIKFKKNKFAEKLIYYSGYSIGNQTLCDEFKSLLPCEYILYKDENLKLDKYYNVDYKYQIEPNKFKNFEETVSKLFNNLKKRYDHCNIIIPLSAGMDSRFILSALKYFNFKKIKLFTHYFINKRDQKIAYKISKYLNYPIEFVNLKINDCKKIYRSENFNKYLNYNLTGNSINNHGDYISVQKLIKKNFIDLKTDIIMNGQSGDFITGNHIPLFLFEDNSSIDQLLEKTLNYIIFKHYNFWSEKQINRDQMVIKDYIKKKYFNNVSTKDEIISMYEKFEFENRQVKWVVGQQKVYDFFGLNCFLPLWSLLIIDFFTKRINLKQRKNQKFYRDFLINKNYSNIWRNIPVNPKEKFTYAFRLIRFISKCFFFFFGKKKWHDFEKKYLNYFMDSTLISTYYDYRVFIKTKKIPRNAAALLARDYLEKNS
tara:strand:- start:405 stop:2015 length:1611 start_codon:yes stop_codon:yes gene_type:complete